MTAQTAQIDSKTLADAVTFVAQSLPPRPNVPALGCIPVNVRNGALTVGVYDYETASKVTVPCEADEGTEFTAPVSGRLLAQMAASLPRGTARLTFNESLTLRCGATKFDLRTIPADDYPTLPSLPPELGTVSGAALADAVNRVAFAATATNPNLAGVFIEADEAGLWLAATDTYRIAVELVDWEPREPDNGFSLVLPAAYLISATKRLAGEPKLTLGFDTANQGRGSFAIDGGWRYITGTQLLPDALPAWRRIIGKFKPWMHADVETSLLADAVRRVELANSTDQHWVTLVFGDGQIELASQATDLADATDAVAAFVDGGNGEPVRAKYNASYLRSALGAVDTAMTRIALNGPKNPLAMLTGLSGDQEPTDHYRHLMAAFR